jgi:hypothetical protein
MLYAAIDMEHKQVTDIILGGDAGHLFQELIDLYNRMTGENRSSFASLDEAKRMCIQAVHARYFPETLVPAARPAPVPAQAPRPMPSIPVQVQPSPITPPWARQETKDGNNPNPTHVATPQPVQAGPPAVTATPTPPPASTTSTEAQGPVARARMVFESMVGAPRKDVIEACAKLGIKRSTASTQYQAWKKAREESTLPDPSKPAGTGNMPRLAPGVYLGPANNQTH